MAFDCIPEADSETDSVCDDKESTDAETTAASAEDMFLDSQANTEPNSPTHAEEACYDAIFDNDANKIVKKWSSLSGSQIYTKLSTPPGLPAPPCLQTLDELVCRTLRLVAHDQQPSP